MIVPRHKATCEYAQISWLIVGGLRTKAIEDHWLSLPDGITEIGLAWTY